MLGFSVVAAWGLCLHRACRQAELLLLAPQFYVWQVAAPKQNVQPAGIPLTQGPGLISTSEGLAGNWVHVAGYLCLAENVTVTALLRCLTWPSVNPSSPGVPYPMVPVLARRYSNELPYVSLVGHAMATRQAKPFAAPAASAVDPADI
uniref:Secreted protein n=1 Tax=Eutreptiella gymnastica TaxID=73025 RepID=A0A7S4CFB9_9EUGL